MKDSVGDETLEALLERARLGDGRALDRWIRDARGRVFRWAVTLTGWPDEAEDVTQEVLVRVQRGLATFRAEAKVSTWLYRITRNVVTSRARKDQARTRAHRRLQGTASEPGPAPDPLEALGDREAARTVRAFLETLPPRQREVLDLVDVQGWSAAEVADALGLEASTVRVHLLRARRNLRARVLAPTPAAAREAGS